MGQAFFSSRSVFVVVVNLEWLVERGEWGVRVGEWEGVWGGLSRESGVMTGSRRGFGEAGSDGVGGCGARAEQVGGAGEDGDGGDTSGQVGEGEGEGGE